MNPELHIHASEARLEIGTVLEPRGRNLALEAVEEVFEAVRPPGCLSRKEAVYVAWTMDAIEAMGLADTDYIYEVQTIGVAQQRDARWLEIACSAWEEGAERALPRIRSAARRYWAGKLSEDPIEEWLVTAAVVADTPANRTTNGLAGPAP